ncbi:unnamed protein product, partial [Sphenostylis stenocarpa]
ILQTEWVSSMVEGAYSTTTFLPHSNVVSSHLIVPCIHSLLGRLVVDVDERVVERVTKLKRKRVSELLLLRVDKKFSIWILRQGFDLPRVL